MRIRVLEEAKGRRYSGRDYAALAEHYEERVCPDTRHGTLCTGRAESAGKAPGDTSRATSCYAHTTFRAQYFGDELATLGASNLARRCMRGSSMISVIRRRRRVVMAPPDRNMLVLAGPGSGKTRVVVHRCAFLLKIARIRPDRILVVCFNRSAMHELRDRIRNLIGRCGARRCCAYLPLARSGIDGAVNGDSCRQLRVKPTSTFDAVIDEANRRLRGEDEVVGVEAEELWDRLLARFEYVLVDEYQDIDARQYELITHVARRPGQDDNERAAILAVGDDDQAIYEWREANVEFLRRFERGVRGGPASILRRELPLDAQRRGLPPTPWSSTTATG